VLKLTREFIMMICGPKTKALHSFRREPGMSKEGKEGIPLEKIIDILHNPRPFRGSSSGKLRAQWSHC